MKRLFVWSMLLGVTLAAPWAHAGPETVGQWSAPFPVMHLARHLTLLPPTDRVLSIFSKGNGPGTLSWWQEIAPDEWPAPHAVWTVQPQSVNSILQPGATPAYRSHQIDIPRPGNAMCGANVLDPFGQFVAYGGIAGGGKSEVFNVTTNAWTPGPNMTAQRYYPSAVRMGNPSRVYVFYGRQDSTDYYDPAGPTVPTMTRAPVTMTLPSDKGEQYPRTFVLPNGTVAMMGIERQTRLMDPAQHTWTNVALINSAGRSNGAVVPLPGNGYRFMTYGGGTAGPLKTAEIIDLSEATPVWRPAASLAFGRFFPNSVLLPTGDIVAVGGKGNPSPYPVELFNSVTETWTTGAAMLKRRDYHSTTVLLRDGRILVMGDPGGKFGEIYSPPYLFMGPRPTLSSAALQATAPGGAITFESDASIARLTMIRPGPTTHGTNFEQRHYELPFTVDGTTVNATVPSNVNWAPPGYYLIFAINGAGVPSIGQWILIQG